MLVQEEGSFLTGISPERGRFSVAEGPSDVNIAWPTVFYRETIGESADVRTEAN